MKRVYDIDLAKCATCVGDFRVLAIVLRAHVIDKSFG